MILSCIIHFGPWISWDPWGTRWIKPIAWFVFVGRYVQSYLQLFFPVTKNMISLLAMLCLLCQGHGKRE